MSSLRATPALLVAQLVVAKRQVLNLRIGGLGKNLGFVSGVAQHALNAQHLVADGVAIAKGREYLMDGGSHR